MIANWQHAQELEQMVRYEFPNEYDRARRDDGIQVIPLLDDSLLMLSAEKQSGGVRVDIRAEQFEL